MIDPRDFIQREAERLRLEQEALGVTGLARQAGLLDTSAFAKAALGLKNTTSAFDLAALGLETGSLSALSSVKSTWLATHAGLMDTARSVAEETRALGLYQADFTGFRHLASEIERLRDPLSDFVGFRAAEARVFADIFRTDEFRLALENFAEEIADEPDEAEANAALAFIKRQVRRLNENQKQELERTSWTTLLLIIIFLLDHYNAYLSDAENLEQHQHTQESIQQVQDAVDEITKIAQEEVLEKAERERIAALPRAVVKHRAYVRVEPKQGADTISVQGRDAVLSIEQRAGRWLLVSYENHLGELESGWVYRSSLEIL